MFRLFTFLNVCLYVYDYMNMWVKHSLAMSNRVFHPLHTLHLMVTDNRALGRSVKALIHTQDDKHRHTPRLKGMDTHIQEHTYMTFQTHDRLQLQIKTQIRSA